MSVPESLTKLVGSWRGHSTLHVPWLDPPQRKSEATASLTPIVNGKFVTIAYTWADEGEPHEGLLLLGQHPESGAVSVAWTDSWHQSGSIMHCNGTVESDGSIRFSGTYPAPPDPDWGWRIEISARAGAGFDIVMTNITPNGEEAIAMESRFDRGVLA